MSTTPPTQGRHETAKAAQAFADYVDLGPDRSIRNLHAEYLKRSQSGTKPLPTQRLGTLKEWSSRFGWQDRITEAINQCSRQKLEAAAELDADTFLLTSRLLNERIHLATPLDAEAVIKMRETVRKPTPKGSTSVSVNLEIRQMVDRFAEEDGLTEGEKQELIEAIERHLAGGQP